MNYTKESNITIGELEENFSTEKQSRQKLVLLLRLEGKTLEEIGNTIGVTRERVRQMEAKGVEIVRHKVFPKIKEQGILIEIREYRIADCVELSTRTINALENNGIRTIGGLARKKITELLEMEGIGEKAVNEICGYLYPTITLVK